MHSFDNAENYKKKKDNWQQLQVFFEKRKIPIVINNIDALILNENDTTLEFVKQIYTLLTERQLMPPIKIYETQQTTESYLLKEKEMVKLPRDELDFLKRPDDMNESKKDGKYPQIALIFHSVSPEPIIDQESAQVTSYKRTI